MHKGTSADGTTIAYDRFGTGQPVILVGGALCTRQTLNPLAVRLAPDFTVISYDRRGRGDSGDTAPYSVEREVEDLGALITAIGGVAAVYGHSSGAGVVVQAAARGLPMTRIVLHEPPYGTDTEENRRAGRELTEQLETLLAADRHKEAVELFLTAAGVPAEAAAEAAVPELVAVAPTLAYDFAVIGNASTGGAVPFDLLGRITQPALALCGTATPDWMIETARQVAEALPGGQYAELDGYGHDAPAEVVAPAVRRFLAG